MPPLALLVSAVGIAQLVSWGTLFYSIGVLGAPLREELGVSELFVFGAFTAGLLVSGTVSPFVGRLNDRRGGRFVLAAGSMLGAASMALLATAFHPAQVLLHLGVCLPIHALLLPRHLAHAPAHGIGGANTGLAEPRRPGFAWLAGAIGAASFVSAVIAVHVVSLLVASGLSQAQAIAIAMLIGPMQVVGRIAEFGFAGRMRRHGALASVAALAVVALASYALAVRTATRSKRGRGEP